MELITDRTLEDVLQGTQKGRYGVADLNRVEQAVQELYSYADALGIVPPGQIKTDWVFPTAFSALSWPTELQMRRYLANITHLCQAVELAGGLPASMENLTFTGANSIEQALLGVYPRIQNALQIIQYSGEIFAGEELL